MDEQFNTVVSGQNQDVLDDAALNPIQPETEPVSPISEITAAEEQPPKNEPGWIRGRIDKAVQKAVRETEERMTAQFEQTLAPLRESMMERQAAELVASGEFKSKEIALDYIRLKGGNVSVTPTAAGQQQSGGQPRDSQGRFVPRQQQQAEEDPQRAAQIQILARQADKIKARTGVDVMSAFQGNADIQAKVFSGEWDFYDVAEAIQKRQTMPSPMRSVGATSFAPTDIDEMSDAQFELLQRNIAAGKIYALN